MNDTELDEMLDQWSAPPPSASLRANVRAGFASRQAQDKRPGMLVRWSAGCIRAFAPGARKILFAMATLAVVTLVVTLVGTPALPQTSPVRIPYSVDSEFVRYADDGSRSVEMHSTSYTQNGAETLLSRSIPGLGFETALGRALDATLPLWQRIMTPLVASPADLEKMKRARLQNIGFVTGCAYRTCFVINHYYFGKAAAGAAGCVAGAVVGRETILNYPTTAVQPPSYLTHSDHPNYGRRRMTLWMAPDLGCFALRITSEEQRPDGAFHVVTVKQALKVTLNP
jgi:hypothetical protein